MKWLLLALLACNSEGVVVLLASDETDAGAVYIPPEQVSLSGGFTPAERDVVLAALGEWCHAVGWCPVAVSSSERGRIVLDHDYARHGRGEDSGAWNDGNDIYLKAPDSPINLRALRRVVLHEAGHWGTGHTAAGLMAERWGEVAPTGLDQEAIDAWCAEQGC